MSAGAAVRVLLLDDHPVVRAGLRALLEGQPDLRVVGEAASATDAVERVRELAPDVVLVDLDLGAGGSGVAATRSVRALPDPPRVLVLTAFAAEADVLAALDAGAHGYLLKDAPAEELFRAVRAVARGETALGPEVAALLVRRVSSPTPALTEREVQLLGLLADGLSNKAMARRLLVSEATVKSHLAHVYAKLGVGTRAAAVATAIERRIIRA